MDANKNSLGVVFNIFNKLSLQQRMLLGGILVFTIVILGFVVFIFNEPNYSTLYSNLAPEDASRVVEHLTAQKVPYKLENNGQTIAVPNESLYEMRLSLAGKGIPSSGIIGYELFDNNMMGMSEFMQKLNFKRALEGELSRTIMQQNGVEGARVHLVFPEKSIFKDEQKQPTASVVLKLNPGFKLTSANINAISNLVSASIEGLQPNKVAIIDTKGRLLSKNDEEDGIGISGGKQYEIKNKVEDYLANKAQSLLDNVLGYGNAIVKINVDLDFKQVDKTMELYDPESQVAISEQVIKSESGGKTMADSSAVVSENTTTNYEISKTIERVVEGAGNIKRLTIAAVINGVTKEVKNGELTEILNEPRSEAQLKQLEQIIIQAVGLDPTRKDQISIVSIPFETQFLEEPAQEEVSPFDEVQKWSNLILIIFAIGASLFVLKGLMKKLKNEKIIIGTVNYKDDSFSDLSPSLSMAGASPSMPQISNKPKKNLLNIGDIEDEITDEAQQRKAVQDKIVNYVAKNPADAAKLINTWLREDEY